MNIHPMLRLALTVAVLCVAAVGRGQTVTVVNMIPSSSSGETNHDSEPNLAVNPSNPLQLAATAFTPDPMGTAGVAPIYLSSDGGNTWSLNSILSIPTMNQCVGNSTCDITPRFAQVSGNLYLSWLTADASFNVPLLIGRTQPFPGPVAAPTNLQTINTTYPKSIDQPFTEAWTALSGANSGDDRVYVGANDLRGGTSGHTASLDASQAAEGAAPAGFGALQGIEVRSTCNQDGPQIRPAVHPSGVVYAAFYRWTAGCSSTVTADIVVVRDDSWGSGSTPYQALKDTDGLAGKIVASAISLPPCNSLVGNQRVCGSLSIAVDPNDNQTVWLAYATGTSATNYTLHVRRSSDGGATWGSDLTTVSPAVNAALAITTDSKVGFLYQELVTPGTCTGGSPCWETHLEITTHGTAWTNVTLANTPDTLTTSINNILGDYEYLAAVGKNFYGVFSANNLPNATNFPQGVTYQRYADLTTAHQLYADAAHTMTVAASVDPFFFSAVNVPAAEDYYVRDWTDSPTSHDNGEEPSTNPVWWTTSDVWNRLTNTAGAFNANDQPAHQVAQDAISGHNYAFVRIHRKAAAATGSPAEQVSASFMFADYGLGVPYQYVTGAPLSSTASLTFAAGDTEHTLADGAGVQWDLPAERSTHVCMAVEIAGPQDPYSPELLGRAPGWPTDLLITTDNNKAQINMDLPPVAQGGGQWQSFGLAHNAALFNRDMTIRYQVAPAVLRRLGAGSFIVASGGRRIPLRTSGVFRLANMSPGESRWIGAVIEPAAGTPAGEMLPVTFEEMAGPNALNGFTIAARVTDALEVARRNLALHRATFHRLMAAFEVEEGERQSAAADKLLKEGALSEQKYLQFLVANEAGMSKAIAELTARTKAASEFQLETSLAALAKAAGAGQAAAAANAHGTLLNELDFGQTIAQKSQGDPDDFLQMVEWQETLYSGSAVLRRTEGARAIVEESREFIAAATHRKAGVADYPALLRRLIGRFHGTAESLEKSDPGLEKVVRSLAEQLETKDLRKVEGRHRQFLMSLAGVAYAHPKRSP